MVSFAGQMLWSLIRSHLLFFVFIFIDLEVGQKRSCCDLCQRVFCLCFPVSILYCPNWWIYLQGRDREQTCGCGGRKWGMYWEAGIDRYTHHVWDRGLVGSCCLAKGAQLGAPWWPRWVGWEVQESENICIHTADSLHCKQKTNTTLKNYIPIKNK